MSSVSNGLHFLTLPLISVMRVIYRKIRHARYLYIKRNAEKVWGARYTLGARYLSKNTVVGFHSSELRIYPKCPKFLPWRNTHRFSLLRVQFVQSVQREYGNLVSCPKHRRFRSLSKLLPCHAERLAGGARDSALRSYISAVIYVFNVSMRNFRNAVNYTPAFLSSKAKPGHSVRKTILFLNSYGKFMATDVSIISG